jgi:alpha-aminoadipate carrier protein LysW
MQLVAQVSNLSKIKSNKSKEYKMNTVSCPECSAEITLDAKVEVGEIVVCPDCGVDLEVISLNPIAVDLAPMEQEDWGE